MAKSEYQKIVAEKQLAKAEVLGAAYNNGNKSPLLVIFAPSKGSKKALSQDQFFQLLEGLLVLPNRVVVVTDSEMADADTHISGQISWVNTENGRNDDVVKRYAKAADMALLFEEHMEDIENLMLNGTVIIGSEESPFLKNYHPNEETGNSFTFASVNPWEIFRALVRAHETYRFPYDWGHIVRGLLKE